jgi:malate dehydrogenase
MKEHSGHYAAGEITAQIVESIAQDSRKVFPVSVNLTGEYGYQDICLALPCVMDKTGVRKIIEWKLSAQEKKALHACAQSITHQIDTLKGILGN